MATLYRPDSLIFDMDGTLWDGVETYAQGFNDFFKAHKIERKLAKNDIAGYMGWEEDNFLEATIPELPFDERKKAYQQIINYQYSRITTDGGILYDGVKEGLEMLSHKYKLFIVSNCPAFTIDYFMKWAKIERYISDTMAHGKNYKHKHENIRLLMDKHNLKTPFYVGDTDSDSRQSALVPLPFVFVDYGFGKTQNFDLCFHSFRDLSKYFLHLAKE
jgi:phosphoglycolate phosphatase